MSRSSRFRCVVPSLALVLAGCAGTDALLPAPHAGAIEGSIASIDTTPWAYDGNAVIRLDTPGRGRVAVELPARWNLCSARAVDVGALAVGMRVRAVGAPDGEGRLVVCADAAHGLVPLE